MACEELCQRIGNFGNLQDELRQLRQQNNAFEMELQEQRTNYSLVISDMVRICDEKQQLCEERDNERFQKEVNSLIIDQYRDEIAEQRQAINAKNNQSQVLAGQAARLEAEVVSLRNRCYHYEQGGKEMRPRNRARRRRKPHAGS